MSKDLLNKIRNRIDNPEGTETGQAAGKPEEDISAKPVNAPQAAPAKKKAAPDKEVNEKLRAIPGKDGFDKIRNTLKAEKENFIFNRRLVYIDDNIGEALDLLRKEAKINSNVLASYLLKQFLLENKDLIKALREKKKGNMFFD
jgi:hypothetical protein